MTVKTMDQHIEISPEVAGGRPHIAGRRITVQNIVLWHERLGMNADEIAAEHDLRLADIHAALAYYFDHRQELDQAIEESEAFVAVLKEREEGLMKIKILCAAEKDIEKGSRGN